jgi:ubiquinone/menaquinone biosynthesis C-methylase UbiE
MALFSVPNINNKVVINLEREVLTGDVLDIGDKNQGIIYSIFKHYNEEAALEYVASRDDKNEIQENSYDSCIMLFSFRNIWLKRNKRDFIKEIHKFLKDTGVLHIWDIDKPYLKLSKCSIKIMLPEEKVKIINISELNLLKDASKNTMLKLLEDYFEVIDFKCSDNIYYIKAKKKGCSINETTTSGNKFKVYTQQFSNKISKSLHK